MLTLAVQYPWSDWRPGKGYPVITSGGVSVSDADAVQIMKWAKQDGVPVFVVENGVPPEPVSLSQRVTDLAVYAETAYAHMKWTSPNAAGLGGGVVLHYDDGNLTDLTIAHPLHVELNMPSVAHICSALLGSAPAHMTGWAQVNELVDSGLWDLGNHTLAHAHLPGRTVPQQESDIADNFYAIRDNTGVTPAWFVAPGHAHNASSQLIAYRLHHKNRSNLGAVRSEQHTFNSLGRLVSMSVNTFPNAASVEALLDELMFRTHDGQLVNVYFHALSNSPPPSSTTPALHEQFLRGLRARNIPVRHPRAEMQHRHNVFPDPLFLRDMEGYNAQGLRVEASDGVPGGGKHYLRLTNGQSCETQAFDVPTDVSRSVRVTIWTRSSRTVGHTVRLGRRRYAEDPFTASNFANFVAPFAPASTDWVPNTYTLDMTGYHLVKLYFECIVSDGVPTTLDVGHISVSPDFTHNYNATVI